MQEVKTKNYYELLGVDRKASSKEIKAAYRDIARVYHPDSNFYADIVDSKLNAQHVEIFKLITAAYHTLSHDEKREQYDRTLGSPIEDWDRPGSNPTTKKSFTGKKSKPARHRYTFGQPINEPGPQGKEGSHVDSEVDKMRSMSEIIKESKLSFHKTMVIIALGLTCFLLTVLVLLLLLQRR